jgi:hypothetical protein
MADNCPYCWKPKVAEEGTWRICDCPPLTPIPEAGDQRRWIVIDVGCAECQGVGADLVESDAQGTWDEIGPSIGRLCTEKNRAPHPSGGWYYRYSSQGGTYVLPIGDHNGP